MSTNLKKQNQTYMCPNRTCYVYLLNCVLYIVSVAIGQSLRTKWWKALKFICVGAAASDVSGREKQISGACVDHHCLCPPKIFTQSNCHGPWVWGPWFSVSSSFLFGFWEVIKIHVLYYFIVFFGVLFCFSLCLWVLLFSDACYCLLFILPLVLSLVVDDFIYLSLSQSKTCTEIWIML